MEERAQNMYEFDVILTVLTHAGPRSLEQEINTANCRSGQCNQSQKKARLWRVRGERSIRESAYLCRVGDVGGTLHLDAETPFQLWSHAHPRCRQK